MDENEGERIKEFDQSIWATKATIQGDDVSDRNKALVSTSTGGPSPVLEAACVEGRWQTGA